MTALSEQTGNTPPVHVRIYAKVETVQTAVMRLAMWQGQGGYKKTANVQRVEVNLEVPLDPRAPAFCDCGWMDRFNQINYRAAEKRAESRRRKGEREAYSRGPKGKSKGAKTDRRFSRTPSGGSGSSSSPATGANRLFVGGRADSSARRRAESRYTGEIRGRPVSRAPKPGEPGHVYRTKWPAFPDDASDWIRFPRKAAEDLKHWAEHAFCWTLFDWLGFDSDNMNHYERSVSANNTNEK